MCDRVPVHIDIVRVAREGRPVLRDHALAAESRQCVHAEVTCAAAVDGEDLALAVLRAAGVRACGAVAVEEAVQACAVDGDIVAVEDAETEGVAVAGEAAAAVRRIVEGGVGGVGAVSRVGVGLVVPGMETVD